MKGRNATKALCEGAILLALAQVLSFLKFYEMPQGGSVTLAMLPVALYAVRWGLKPGLLAGFVFGLLQVTFDGGFAWGWQSIIGDYLLAFTPLGLAGLFRKQKFGLFWGLAVGAFVRFLVHFVTGATVWAAYMPETFTSPWIYSFAYNGPYMGVSLAMCLVVAGLLYMPLRKYILAQDIQ